MLEVQEVKFSDFGRDLVYRAQKLKVVSTFALERDNLAKDAEEWARLAEEWARSKNGKEWAKQAEEQNVSLDELMV